MSDSTSRPADYLEQQIFGLAEQVAEQATADEHLRAVQAQMQVANRIFVAICRMGFDQNGLAAESLLRTLFETAINAIILAKHKELLKDFIRQGHFQRLQMLRFTDIGREQIDALIKSTEDDWQKLSAEFKHTDWHKLKTSQSFSEAEMPAGMYDKYFRRASAFAHGEPYVVVRNTDETFKNWTAEAQPDLWKWLAEGATIHAYFVMWHLLAIIDREFKFGLEEVLKELVQQLEAGREKLSKAAQSALEV